MREVGNPISKTNHSAAQRPRNREKWLPQPLFFPRRGDTEYSVFAAQLVRDSPVPGAIVIDDYDLEPVNPLRESAARSGRCSRFRCSRQRQAPFAELRAPRPALIRVMQELRRPERPARRLSRGVEFQAPAANRLKVFRRVGGFRHARFCPLRFALALSTPSNRGGQASSGRSTEPDHSDKKGTRLRSGHCRITARNECRFPVPQYRPERAEKIPAR